MAEGDETDDSLNHSVELGIWRGIKRMRGGSDDAEQSGEMKENAK